MEPAAAGSDLNSSSLVQLITQACVGEEPLRVQLYKESCPRGNHPQTL